jgi:hypothetical protein
MAKFEHDDFGAQSLRKKVNDVQTIDSGNQNDKQIASGTRDDRSLGVPTLAQKGITSGIAGNRLASS